MDRALKMEFKGNERRGVEGSGSRRSGSCSGSIEGDERRRRGGSGLVFRGLRGIEEGEQGTGGRNLGRAAGCGAAFMSRRACRSAEFVSG